MKKKKKVGEKKLKIRVPKIKFTKEGRKYITIKKQIVYLEDDVTQNQLLKYVLGLVLKKRKMKRNDTKVQPSSGPAVYSSSATGTNTADLYSKIFDTRQKQDKLDMKLSQAILPQREIKAIMSDDSQHLLGGPSQALLPERAERTIQVVDACNRATALTPANPIYR